MRWKSDEAVKGAGVTAKPKWSNSKGFFFQYVQSTKKNLSMPSTCESTLSRLLQSCPSELLIIRHSKEECKNVGKAKSRLVERERERERERD